MRNQVILIRHSKIIIKLLQIKTEFSKKTGPEGELVELCAEKFFSRSHIDKIESKHLRPLSSHNPVKLCHNKKRISSKLILRGES